MGKRRKLLITAGPTHEPIDAVRYVANRSSGRLGTSLASAAHDAGWDVTLLLGPVTLPAPAGVHIAPFESTADLATLLEEHFPHCDVLIMAAAVADYRPRSVDAGKLPRTGDSLTIDMEATPDLVAACAAHKREHQRLIGFALEEPASLPARARAKLQRKGLDAIIANPLATMGSDDIEAVLLTADGRQIRPPASHGAALDKPAFARWLIRWIDAEL